MKRRTIGNTGIDVFPLGFGVMRLPMKDGGRSNSRVDKSLIDVDASVAMIREAIDNGLDYLDTAYPYVGGVAEKVLGLALKDGYREKVRIATKTTPWLQNDEGDFEKMMSEQFERIGTDYFDFYMIHSINDDSWRNKVLPLGLVDKLFAAKRDGKVGHVGFSFHDNIDLFKEIVDYAPWDFCQIQLNYFDMGYQAGIEGLKYAASKGLGVIIMEPLRGGYLADIPQDVSEILGKGKNPVEHALDFLWDMPEVSLVLSGMYSSEQVRENMEYASRSNVGMLSDEERAAFAKARERLLAYGMIPCTGCAYCMPCPKGICIPNNFAVYNEYCTHKNLARAKDAYKITVPLFGERASDCVGCRSCEKLCPQNIEISAWLNKIDEMFG